MREFFVTANSFGAPFFSDTSESYVKGENELEAMENFVKQYKHPCGLYAARLYKNADAYHKGKKVLAKYDCNVVLKLQEVPHGSVRHTSKDEKTDILELDHKIHEVKNPRQGVCSLV